MMKMHRLAALLASGAAFALALTSCSAGGGDDPAAPGETATETTTLSVALVGGIFDGALNLGITEGFFADEGLELDVSNVASPAAGIAAVSGGQVDLAYSPSIPLLNALGQGVDLRVIAPANGFPDGAIDADNHEELDDAGLYVGASTGITSVEELAGKTIAVLARKGHFEIVVANELENAGVGADQVEWVVLDQASSVEALRTGTIDATALFAPFSGQATAAGAALIALPNISFVEEGPLAYYISSSSTTEQNAEAMARFQRAITKAHEFANEHREAATQAGLDAIESPLSVDQITMPYWPTALRLADLERANQKLVRLNVLTTPVDLSNVLFED